MDDWQVNDLALCIWKRPANDGLRVGALYTVSEVVGGGFGLAFTNLAPKDGGYWMSDRFIKITPEEADDFDATVIYELNYAPSPAFTNAEMEARVPSPASTPTLAGDVVGQSLHNKPCKPSEGHRLTFSNHDELNSAGGRT